jgi:peroxiredoxin
LQAAKELLALRDKIHQQAGFRLQGLDGKEYSLAALRGKVVLLNFWAKMSTSFDITWRI